MKNRTDQQTTAPAGSPSSTSTTSKGSVPSLLSFAVESGALTESVNGTTTTVQATLANVLNAINGTKFMTFYRSEPSNPSSPHFVDHFGISFLQHWKQQLVDINVNSDVVSFRGDRMIQPRRIPISKEVHDLLQSYLRSEERKEVSTQNVFVSKHGRPLRAHWMTNAFARLRVRAGVIRIDGGKCPPRMRDIRQTFAVHRIASWIKEGADLNRMLPAVSA